MDVKICGINSEEALDAAIEAGADLIGLVHYPRSPRHLDLEAARRLAARAHERSRVRVVMLLVDPDDGLVAGAAAAGADIIQLHGHESRERVRAVRALAGRPVMKAARVATKEDVEAALPYLEPGSGADILLFDAAPPPGGASLPGGNGLAFDWHILEGLGARTPFALAGGLTPENVAAAIRLVGPALVDVSSGVERAPGVKDAELIRRFIRAAKTANEAEFVGPGIG